MNHNVRAVIKREYMTRIRTKAFWIGTALFPLLIVAMGIIPGLLAARARGSEAPIRVVDQTGDFFPLLQLAVQQNARGDAPPLELEDPRGRPLEQIRRELNDQVESGGSFQGYLIIDEEAVREGSFVLYGRNPTGMMDAEGLTRGLREAVVRYRLARFGIPDEDVRQAVQRVDIDARKATNDPKRDQSGLGSLLMSVGLVFFIYVSLIVYGMYVLQGVLEEKSSRVVEVIISSVRPFDLMLGKLLGIGAIGLTQISIWLLSAVILTAPQLLAAMSIAEGMIRPPEPHILAFFAVYFILGFFLFATLYAGIGAMFNSMEDAQQVAGIANLLIIGPMLFIGPVLKNPSGTLAEVLSLIPFFAPVLMFLRITLEMPPVWQIAASLGIMVASIAAMTWLVSKIYRVGILMYGKKPTIPEVLRWLRYT